MLTNMQHLCFCNYVTGNLCAGVPETACSGISSYDFPNMFVKPSRSGGHAPVCNEQWCAHGSNSLEPYGKWSVSC